MNTAESGSSPSGTPLDAGTRLLVAGILHTYQAALQPQPWQQIMRAIAPLVGTDKAMFARVDRTHPRDSVTEVEGLADQYVQALKNRDLAHDHIWRAVLAIPAGRAYRTTELLPANVLRSGPLYEQVAVPAGLDYVLGGVLENDPRFFSLVCFMKSAVDFDDRHKAVLQALLPHLQTAVQISLRVAAGDAGRREALLSFDRVQQALVVLDRSGYAIYSNETAKRVLDNATGLQLKFGRFLFDSVTAQTEFEHAVRTAVVAVASDDPPTPQRIRVTRRDAGPPYVFSVIPVVRWSDRVLLPDGAGCMVMIYDEEGRKPLPVERLAWLYRLTPAEARTCEALFQAGSVEAAAGRLSLTQHTIRSHLKSIYSKFGVASQSQLMQRLASAAARQQVDMIDVEASG